jgi:predicted N-acyltransferase
MHLRVHTSLAEIPPATWDALHDGSNPFVSHAFLVGLERTGCLRPRWGWTPAHAALYDGGALIAAAPVYRKDNSHGEFVFDHAWAAAYARHGRDYYPKWLIGVPYSPVTGPRLLACDAVARAALAQAIADRCASDACSSAHINFLPEIEVESCDPRWLARNDLQFHWSNASDDGSGWRDFDDFLGAMTHKRRKAIRQERDKVRRAGYEFRVVTGADASAADLAAMHAFYCLTFAEKGNSPALTLEFFRYLAQTLPQALVLILAERAGRTVAGALCLRGQDTLYGRYWGGEETAPGLHFETCYYQGIAYCLREGLTRFEPGAQGEHKLARGFLPTLTHSRHFIADPGFAEAIGAWCAQERTELAAYREFLLQHSPFRVADSSDRP